MKDAKNLRELSKKTSRTFWKKIGNSEKKVREHFFGYSPAFFEISKEAFLDALRGLIGDRQNLSRTYRF
ncbi:MAG: hypothetical protein Q4A61_00480 [Porphyromonadaceae bacterium]|nr:hypothetical protein [Porphyromonadaceae bacterium]